LVDIFSVQKLWCCKYYENSICIVKIWILVCDQFDTHL